MIDNVVIFVKVVVHCFSCLDSTESLGAISNCETTYTHKCKKNCCFITMCKAHSIVTHIKQQKYFHHFKFDLFLVFHFQLNWWFYLSVFLYLHCVQPPFAHFHDENIASVCWYDTFSLCLDWFQSYNQLLRQYTQLCMDHARPKSTCFALWATTITHYLQHGASSAWFSDYITSDFEPGPLTVHFC